MTGISQLLLIRFWPYFKGRILGPCLKYANCYGNICPGNICQGDICRNKQYWNFRSQIFLDPKFFKTFFMIKKNFGPKFFFKTIFQTKNLFWPPIFFRPNFFFRPKFFILKFFQIFTDPQFLWTQKYFDPICLRTFVRVDHMSKDICLGKDRCPDRHLPLATTKM